MPWLHLPVQSGSDRILRAMNRKHGRQKYFDLIDRVRSRRPDIALSGDFIVGFPGETDADFEATLSLIAEVGYAQAYSFAYSPRPGTPAATMEMQIPKDVMSARLQALQAAINVQQHGFNQASVGTTTQVLLERRGKLADQFIGKSPWLQSVHVVGDHFTIGDVIDVKLVAAGPNSLTGKPLMNPMMNAA